MNKTITVVLLFLSLNTFGDYPGINITNFKGNYQAPEGSGSADSFRLPYFKKESGKLVQLKVTQKENGYQFHYGSEEYFYENPPEFLKDVDVVSWKKTSITAKKKRATASLASLDATGREGEARIRDLYLNCLENNSQITDLTKKLIDGCSANSQGRFREVFINQYNNVDGAIKGLSDALQLFSTEEKLAGTDTINLTNMKFNINNHRLDLSVKVNLSMKATIKVKGMTWYESDKNRIKVKIDKIKAGLFNITSKVFKELKKSESETFKVQKPYVYIQLK